MGEIRGTEAQVRECPFCMTPTDRIVATNDHAFAIRDLYPVSSGHSLVIPKRHVGDWWQANRVERAAIAALVDEVKAGIDAQYAPDGYNVGFNDGAAAGQTVFHLHVHVIPRYDGDVNDPRGGVRHVLPERANYLADMPEEVEEESAAEAVFGPEVEASALIQRVLAVLDEGRRSATYKPALLLALVELAVERVDGMTALQLPLDDIADRVMELYWPQTRPHEGAAGALRQVTAKSSRIIDSLTGLRQATKAPVNQSLGHVRIAHPQAYARARARIARALALQPIPRLQRPGNLAGAGTYPRFLYDDVDFEPEKGWRGPGGVPVVRLLPGVADALARSAPLLRMAAQDIWVREVAAINRMDTQEQQLRAFLFGSNRVALRAVADGLRDLGVRRCFWCEAPLPGAVEVDHVIPWSNYPNDDLFNLVLADPGCNNDKRDRLVTASLIERWTHRDRTGLRQLAAELDWPLAPLRSGRVAASVYRYLPLGMPVWAARRQVQAFSHADRRRVVFALQSLAA